MATIGAYNAPLGGQSWGRNPLVSHFLCATLRLRPESRTRVPEWDLAVVLEGLCKALLRPLRSLREVLNIEDSVSAGNIIS